MARAFFYSPHPDDETLSMGLAMLYYIANGVDVHLVSITNGSALGVAYTLNGSTDAGAAVACTISDHPYIHNPAREGYPLAAPAARLTAGDVGAARNREARSALAAMAMVPPVTPGVTGSVTHHIEDLPGDFAGTGSSSTSPVTPEGIAQAKAIIKRYVDAYPNSFHFTMSQTDDHHDHAACGFGLRELMDDTTNKVPWADISYHDALVNARFFVSRLYWATSQPDGKYPADVASMPALAWFNYSGSNYSRFCDWLRNQVVKPYRAWNPAEGAYGIGYHQVAAQFASNFGTGVSIGNLWHA
jgi:LmbE family N-acetylglucosaminyl deacetylase